MRAVLLGLIAVIVVAGSATARKEITDAVGDGPFPERDITKVVWRINDTFIDVEIHVDGEASTFTHYGGEVDLGMRGAEGPTEWYTFTKADEREFLFVEHRPGGPLAPKVEFEGKLIRFTWDRVAKTPAYDCDIGNGWVGVIEDRQPIPVVEDAAADNFDLADPESAWSDRAARCAAQNNGDAAPVWMVLAAVGLVVAVRRRAA